MNPQVRHVPGSVAVAPFRYSLLPHVGDVNVVVVVVVTVVASVPGQTAQNSKVGCQHPRHALAVHQIRACGKMWTFTTRAEKRIKLVDTYLRDIGARVFLRVRV